MLKDKIETLVKQSIASAIEHSELGELKEVPNSIAVESPKQAGHGDRALNVAMSLAKQAKIKPRDIAENISKYLNNGQFEHIEIAGPGFINLTLSWDLLEDAIAEIHEQDADYGKAKFEDRPDTSFARVLVEYVSANPTGDLHIGHGRQAVLGSALAELLKWAGYQVESEFYINDAGAQITKLAKSAKAAMLVTTGKMTEADYPEDGYPLESMLEFLKPDDFKNISNSDTQQVYENLEDIPEAEYGEHAKKVFLAAQEKILANIKTNFETWYSEKQLHKADRENISKVDQTLKALENSGAVYEEEGAKWFKAEDYGDERNRVLVKSNGLYTYLTADLAYHQDKILRKFDKLINVWGADHHGQEPGLRGGLEALGEPHDRLEIVFIQMVSLKEGETKVKMSKREGTVVTIGDVVGEVGVDAFRYFLVESQANNHMAFDMELAKKQDKDNPVYYIQYAHARSCSILRTLAGEQMDGESKSLEKPVLSQAEIDELQKNCKTNKSLFANFKDLNPEELASTKALILHLTHFPQEIKDAASKRAPYRIATYLKELATLYHQFYTHNRVIVDDKDLMKARLSLVLAAQKVLRNGLNLLGVSAPERM